MDGGKYAVYPADNIMVDYPIFSAHLILYYLDLFHVRDIEYVITGEISSGENNNNYELRLYFWRMLDAELLITDSIIIPDELETLPGFIEWIFSWVDLNNINLASEDNLASNDNVETDDSDVLESFTDGGSIYTWKVEASRFAEQDFPATSYVDSWPFAAYEVRPIGWSTNSFGIWGRFSRRGYNWIDIYPVLSTDIEEKPFEIPIPGLANSLSIWVWGMNLNYSMEIYLRDHLGVVHSFILGTLNFPGWRNLTMIIPDNLREIYSRSRIPLGMSLVKFRIWTTPEERSDDFYVFLHRFSVIYNVTE